MASCGERLGGKNELSQDESHAALRRAAPIWASSGWATPSCVECLNLGRMSGSWPLSARRFLDLLARFFPPSRYGPTWIATWTMKFPDTPLPSPTDLDHRIPRAIAGDRDALESLLVVYYDDLLVFIESRMSAQLRAVHDVEDVLHETVISAFLAVTRLEARSNREFRNWLRTIAEHRIIDLARSLRGKVRGGDFHRVTTVATESGSLVDLLDLCVAELSKASAKVRREEGVQELQKQLATLPDHYRRAVELRFLRELSLAETAQAMELSEAQVRNILYRAREILIDRLGNSSLYRFHD